MAAVNAAEIAFTGRQIPPLEPGSPQWLQHMSASKIAAVVGLSPYESRFSLWHRMAGLIPQPEVKAHLARGHYLEAGVAAWFADQHPDWDVIPAGCWAHHEQPRYTASPDRLLRADTWRLLELKTAADTDEWGQPGTDEIPAGYKAQVQWQMYVTGAPVTHVAVLSAYLEFNEYVVTADAGDQEFLASAAAEFLDTLPGQPGEQRPDIDAHDATYEAVRQLHPLIEDRKTEVPPEVALRYLEAVELEKTATAELRAAKSALLDAMALARIATFGDRPIARRQPGRGDSVSLYVVKG